jgi:hypothetical protein
MIERPSSPSRQAQRLLALYPAQWRARYGEEFAQLLIDDISERPRSRRRTIDVIRSGLLARAGAAGLRADPLAPLGRLRASLAALGAALAVFLAFGVGIWSQLTIGWQWSAPAAPATEVGMVVMSAAMLGFVALAALAAIPLGWSLSVTVLRGQARHLVRPLTLVVIGLAVLAAGSVHFGHGWPGTGGHPWSDHGLVPSVIARFCWAATLWITSYWAHPGALRSFPASEIAWMAISPLALAALLAGAAQTLGRLPLTPRMLRYGTWLGAGAAVAMAAFMSGAASWIVSGGPAPRGLFHVGLIDGIELAVMGTALMVAFRAIQRALPARAVA